MCPSFRATREEGHSTRGRAHLLWEMTKGDVIRDGWRDQHVKDSLDLCLACWQVDWNRNGDIDERDLRMLQVEYDAHGEQIPEGDPRRTPTFCPA